MMNKQKLLSISIASFNTEEYINRTLDSFIIPEIMEELEVIVVDDGSKDKTAEIAGEYVKRYPDTFALISKQNGGYGSTINASHRTAKGKFFKTVDGDDYVEREGMIRLVNYLRTCDDDIIVTNYSRVSDKTGKTELTGFVSESYEVSLRFDDVYKGQELYMQAITFKTDLLLKAGLELTEHCFYTDIEYILTPVPFITTISFLPVNVYMYRIAVNEQSMSVAGKRKHIDEQKLVFEKMLDYFNQVNRELSDAKREYFEIILENMYKSHVSAILSLDTRQSSLKRLLDLENHTKQVNVAIYERCKKFKTV